MDHDSILKEWNGLRPLCGLTGKVIQHGDYTVWFPHFITDKEDPFWRYNERSMLREAFDEWEQREAFLARWYESVYTHVIPHVNVLVSQESHLVWLVEPPPMVVMNFLVHGFALNIPRKEWKATKNFLSRAPRRHSKAFCLSDRWQISVRAEENRVRVTYEPFPTSKEGRRDRILLTRSEWQAFQETLRDVDLLLSRMDK